MNNGDTKICQNCKQDFEIEPDDFAFYEKIKVPLPTWCWRCRLQRRLTWRNERALYKRKCSLCGREIIAMYPEGTAFPVYCRECFYSDKWDSTAYGRDYDFSKPFFAQYKELQAVVPRVAIQINRCVNCDYTNQIADSKNCYLVTSASYDEDCLYGYRLISCRNVMDSFLMLKCENCYESLECRDSAELIFSENAADDLNLVFCYDARGSQNCFMSANLRRALHRFRGEPFAKEEYEKKMREEVDLGSHKNILKYGQEYQELLARSLHRPLDFKNIVNSVGHVLSNSKNAYYCFGGSDLENCRYCLLINDAKDSMDINNGCCVMELNYEVCTMGVNAYGIKFSVDAWPDVRNLAYCDCCRNGSTDLFGSISLLKKQYCILNKQYTKEEYENLVPKIIEHMDKMPYRDQEGRIYAYGEFFPPELSPFAYNETPAQDYFPVTEEKARELGLRWRNIERTPHAVTVKASELPDHIKDVSDSILKEVIGCAHEGKCNDQCTGAFRIIQQELQFYKKMNLALPRLCPNCRHYERFRRMNPIQIWKRRCDCNLPDHFHGEGRCPSEFETSYAPERKETVYCEQCYQKEIV